MNNVGMMSLEDFEVICRQYAGRMNQFALVGNGDPDQNEHFEEILKLCRKYNIVPTFTTSGLGITPEIAKICKEYCGAVVVSMYSRILDTVPMIALRERKRDEEKVSYKSREDIPVLWTYGNEIGNCKFDPPAYVIDDKYYHWDEYHHITPFDLDGRYELYRVYEEKEQDNNYTFRAIKMLLDAGVKTNIHFIVDNDNIEETLVRLTNGGIPDGIDTVVLTISDSDFDNDSKKAVEKLYEAVQKPHNFKIELDRETDRHEINFDHNAAENLVKENEEHGMFNELYEFLTGKNRNNKELIPKIMGNAEMEFNSFLKRIGYQEGLGLDSRFITQFKSKKEALHPISLMLVQVEIHIEQYLLQYDPADVNCELTNDGILNVTLRWNAKNKNTDREMKLFKEFGAKDFTISQKGKETTMNFLLSLAALPLIIEDSKIISYDIWNAAQDAFDKLMMYTTFKDVPDVQVYGYLCKCIFANLCNILSYNGPIAKEIGLNESYASALTSQVRGTLEKIDNGQEIYYEGNGYRLMNSKAIADYMEIWEFLTNYVSERLLNNLCAKKDKMYATTMEIVIEASFYRKGSKRVSAEKFNECFSSAMSNMTYTDPDLGYGNAFVVADDKSKSFLRKSLNENCMELCSYNIWQPSEYYPRLRKDNENMELIKDFKAKIKRMEF